MSGEQTIREHLEAIVKHKDASIGIRRRAVAALSIWDEAVECWLTPCMRSWHPLRLDQAQKHCDEHGCGSPVLGRFSPDPLPRVSSVPDAPHATKETTT